MSSVNKVILIGNLGHSPKLSYTTNNQPVCQISMATTRKFVGANKQIHEDTQWHRVVAYGRLAEVIEQYVQKGNKLYVEGFMRTRKYTGRDGTEKTVTEVIAEKCQFFSNKATNAQDDGAFYD